MSYTAQFTPAAQALIDRMLDGAEPTLVTTDPEFVERVANFAFDEVVNVSKTQLTVRQQFMCWIATTLGSQGIDAFRMLAPAALNVGVEPVALREVVYQAVAYLGIGRVFPFVRALDEVFEERGIELPLPEQAATTPDEESRYEMGEVAQCAAIGERARGMRHKGHPDYPWISQWLVKNCFGDWYTRGGLTIPEREMVTFCYIAAQGGCESQLRAHAAANVQCGNDRDFLIAVVSNNVPFIGYPRTLNAMAVVEEITGKKE